MAVSNTNARSSTLDGLLSSTWDEYHKDGEFQDAIFKSNYYFYKLYQAGRITKNCSGTLCAVNLMYAENENAQSVGPYDTFATDATDGFTQALYPWCEYVVPVIIDRISKVKNSGKAAIVDLVDAKRQQAKMTAISLLNKHLMDIEDISKTATGNGGKNIYGLPLIVATDNTYDPAGIDTSANTWWDNKRKSWGDVDSYAGFRADVQDTYLQASEGPGGAPDIGVCDRITWAAFERSMIDQRRYTSGESASMGFPTIMYWKCEVGFDEHVPDLAGGANWDAAASPTGTGEGTLWFVNSNFMELKVMRDSDFVSTGFMPALNQLASINHLIFAGQHVCSNRRKQAVLQAIEGSACVS